MYFSESTSKSLFLSGSAPAAFSSSAYKSSPSTTLHKDTPSFLTLVSCPGWPLILGSRCTKVLVSSRWPGKNLYYPELIWNFFFMRVVRELACGLSVVFETSWAGSLYTPT